MVVGEADGVAFAGEDGTGVAYVCCVEDTARGAGVGKADEPVG